MGKFKALGNNLKFSEIVNHFTEHLDNDPLEYNLSHYYRGGRYILERKDIYTAFFEIKDSTSLSRASIPNPSGLYLISSSAKPRVGDKVQFTRFDTGEVFDEDACPEINVVYPHAFVAEAAATVLGIPLYETMSAGELAVFSNAYWVGIGSPNPFLSTNAYGFALQPGDKTGIVTKWEDKLGRCKVDIIRGDFSYRRNITGGELNNPSTSIPVEVPGDEEGTQIKFSDFAGGYGNIKETSKNTSFNTSVQTGYTVEVGGTRQTTFGTTKSTQYKEYVQTSKTHYWQTAYPGYRPEAYWQHYTYYVQISGTTVSGSTYQPSVQESRRAQNGLGPIGTPFRYSLVQGGWRQSKSVATGQRSGPFQGHHKLYRAIPEPQYLQTNSTKTWQWTKYYYKQTSKDTSWSTSTKVQQSLTKQTTWQTKRNTLYTFWD